MEANEEILVQMIGAAVLAGGLRIAAEREAPGLARRLMARADDFSAVAAELSLQVGRAHSPAVPIGKW